MLGLGVGLNMIAAPLTDEACCGLSDTCSHSKNCAPVPCSASCSQDLLVSCADLKGEGPEVMQGPVLRLSAPFSGCLHPCRVLPRQAGRLILTWQGQYHDQVGGSPKARLNHCTQAVLTFANSPNVGISTAQFLILGDCVRAFP